MLSFSIQDLGIYSLNLSDSMIQKLSKELFFGIYSILSNILVIYNSSCLSYRESKYWSQEVWSQKNWTQFWNSKRYLWSHRSIMKLITSERVQTLDQVLGSPLPGGQQGYPYRFWHGGNLSPPIGGGQGSEGGGDWCVICDKIWRCRK